MELKKYLCVDANDITLIDYVFVDYNVDESYPKPNSIIIGGDTSVKIFEKNHVPKEYQKIYMECNAIKMIVNEINNTNRQDSSKYNRFKARELLTDTGIYLAFDKNGNIFGQMVGDKPTFDVNNCKLCEKNEIIKFLVDLRSNQMLDNYLKSIGEIMHLNIRSYFDTNLLKVKKYSKTKNS